MHKLGSFGVEDLREMSDAIHALDGGRNMEELAGRLVRLLYDDLVVGDAGEPACALVRMFKTHPYEHLEPRLQELVTKAIDVTPNDDMKCLVLMGTAGEKPDWNARQQSAGHQVIPLPSEKAIARAPMIARLIEQLGLPTAAVVTPDSTLISDLHDKTYNVFYVPKALGSQYIPAQTEFVERYGVESVVGFGGILPSGDLFVFILFSKVHIPRGSAELFKILALSVKSKLIRFDAGAVFASGAKSKRFGRNRNQG